MSSATPLFFLLKGDHPTLPRAEVEAIMEAEGFRYTLRQGAPQVFRCLAAAGSSSAVAGRAYYARLCAEESCSSDDSSEAILFAIREVDFRMQLKPGERFRVSLRRVRGSAPEADLRRLRERIVNIIRSQTGAGLSLHGPDVRFLGILSGGGFYFGRVLGEVEKRLGGRRARRRPFFHPSTLQPKLAGCMVNLTRIRPPEPLLDPFCGAGALLMEALALGCRPVGMDLSPVMVEGSGRNLEHLSAGAYDLMVGDARRLPIREVGAVASDPPYGRAASTRGAEIGGLYQAFFNGVADLISARGFLCVAAPRSLCISSLAEEEGFRRVESHLVPVHGSLTREVAVFRRG